MPETLVLVTAMVELVPVTDAGMAVAVLVVSVLVVELTVVVDAIVDVTVVELHVVSEVRVTVAVVEVPVAEVEVPLAETMATLVVVLDVGVVVGVVTSHRRGTNHRQTTAARDSAANKLSHRTTVERNPENECTRTRSSQARHCPTGGHRLRRRGGAGSGCG